MIPQNGALGQEKELSAYALEVMINNALVIVYDKDWWSGREFIPVPSHL